VKKKTKEASEMQEWMVRRIERRKDWKKMTTQILFLLISEFASNLFLGITLTVLLADIANDGKTWKSYKVSSSSST
jgi:hypothetical protein